MSVLMKWVPYALVTVLTWGLYGAFLAKGADGFAHDRIKAFLFVGMAYFLVAVLVPLVIIAINGTGFSFQSEGIKWSLFAGTLGAIGALTVLFALSNNPERGPVAAAQVMSLIFAGAPIVAALYGLLIKYQAGTLKDINPIFFVGLILAASGGALVTLFKP